MVKAGSGQCKVGQLPILATYACSKKCNSAFGAWVLPTKTGLCLTECGDANAKSRSARGWSLINCCILPFYDMKGELHAV
jgi:hypothetical protein